MEDHALSFGLSNASRSYQSMLKSHFELCIDLEDVDGDDELKTAYPCPFCAEDFDLLELWCHIDVEHPIAKTGICPVCSMWVGMSMVEHITTQHGNTFKSQHKSRRLKLESHPTISSSRKDLQGGHWQSFSAGSSPVVVSTPKTARDPFLSFLYYAAAADECGNVQPDSSSAVSIEEIHSDKSDDSVLERDAQPSLSDKDHIENGRRSGFVQGLLMSTILDPDF